MVTRQLPTGTVTFLFTDIEDSTGLARKFGSEFPGLVADHFSILKSAISDAGGIVINTTGDGVFAVFESVASAIEVASALQMAIAEHTWPEGGVVKVRVGVHTGEATITDDDYAGIEVHRAARIMSAGHGGQVLASDTTRLLAGSEFEFKPLGRLMLRGLEQEEAIFQLIVPGLPSDFSPPRTARLIANNLPTRLTPLIGREPDLDAIKDLVERSRLTTVLGPGGVGKTSLAVSVGKLVLDQYPGGVVFVDLSGIAESRFVVSAIADNVGTESKSVEGISARLGDDPTLLILDNFEQVLDASADVGAVLEATDQMTLLVTSQAPLRLRGEQRYMLGPMSDEPDSAGVDLFYERARAVDPSFEASRQDVANLVAKLDGLPLAIELAAARVNLLAPDEMADRIEAVGSGVSVDVGPGQRQRSLADALGWSYGLLDEATASVFRRLSVFASDMSLGAVEEIAGFDGLDVLTALGELVDRSFVVRLRGQSTRFRLLDGIRRFARALLDQSDEAGEIRRRYASYYAQLGNDAYIGLQTDKGEWWRALFDDEQSNIRDVLSMAYESGDATSGLQLLGDTWRFFQSRGRLSELDLWLDRFFGLPGVEEGSRSHIMGLMARGALEYWREEPTEALRCYEHAVVLARGLDDRSLIADALLGLATSHLLNEDPHPARSTLVEAAMLYEDIGDPGGYADVVAAEGFIDLRLDGLVGLGPAFEKVTELYIAAGRRIQATQGMFAQTAVALAEGRLADARVQALIGIRSSVELADVFLQTWGLEYLAVIEIESENLELGGLYTGATERSRENIGGGWGPKSVGLATPVEMLQERLGNDGAEHLMRAGREVEFSELVARSLEDETNG